MLEIWRNELGVNASPSVNEVFGEEVVAKVASQQYVNGAKTSGRA